MSDGPWPDLGTTLDDLPDDLRARIKAELAPGERLLWAARGEPRRPKSDQGCLVIALSVLAAGVGALSLAGLFFARPPSTDNFLQNIGIVLALMGGFGTIGALVGQSLNRASRWKVTVGIQYALTDRRAIIWRPVAGTAGVEVHSIGPSLVNSVHRLEYADGSGDVVLGLERGTMTRPPHQIEGVRDVRRVEDLVRRTLLRPEPPVA